MQAIPKEHAMLAITWLDHASTIQGKTAGLVRMFPRAKRAKRRKFVHLGKCLSTVQARLHTTILRA
jgi:hypothetical protein